MQVITTPKPTFGVVDLFAGPGGLAEGFSAFENCGEPAFRVRLSVEMERSAHQTLLLRTFLREFPKGFPNEYYDWLNKNSAEPNWNSLYPEQFEKAQQTALHLELGNPANTMVIHERIDGVRREFGLNTVLIGGPPCQAYSLVGRARNAGKAGYDAADDKRHFLYEAYIDVLHRLKPVAFIMENVKGILSSSVGGEAIFRRILEDLKAEGYKLVALTPRASGDAAAPDPSDFIVRAEDYGLPQARHRVIIVGLRSDLRETQQIEGLQTSKSATVRDILSGMPRLRSGLSGGCDSPDAWRDVVLKAAARLQRFALPGDVGRKQRFHAELQRVVDTVGSTRGVMARSSRKSAPMRSLCPSELAAWINDPRLNVLPNHETRGHMPSDLGRYLFASAFAAAAGRSPKAGEFPRFLAPEHANWESGKFADRFRVQYFDRPSSTITSHISKDGHYFIHPDASQCRSLTVREAARLQTFPDNYVFKGNRTQQFVQVGNAVPPLLARNIASALYALLNRAMI